jgi:hypothetical protein
VFGNGIDISVTGTRNLTGAYILFNGLQLGHSDNENMYLDQQNEIVICAANCMFRDANQNPSVTPQGALVIGPDATAIPGGLTPVIAQFNQGFFASTEADNDIYFQNTGGGFCNCRVALGDGMLNLSAGTIKSNNAVNVTGPTTYAPPLFGNAASIGVPLTLGPAELGIGVSTGTASRPNGSGVKLRVECSTGGKAKIVVLAGTLSTPTTLLDGIGGGVTCPP